VKKLIVIAALIPQLALAASAWDGTWRTKVDTIKSTGKPDVFEVVGGQFKCPSCVPPITVPADGKDHPVTGHAYYDTYAVRVVDASTIERTSKLKGAAFYVDTMSVSADHDTLTESFVDHSGAEAVKVTQTSKRVAPGKPGSHAVSGGWQQTSTTQMNNAGTTATIQTTDDGWKVTYNGIVTDAKFDGKPVPQVGDKAHTMAAFKRLNGNTIEETDTRDGKVVDVTHWSLSKDGKTMHAVDHDKVHDVKTEFTLNKVN